MKLITQRSIIQRVRQAWDEQYGKRPEEDKAEVARGLRKLDLDTATPADIKAVIGNDSWTDMPKCDECGKSAKALVEMGEDPDYESHTAIICAGCLRKAVKLLP